jgi:hypothetical protein
MDARVAKLPMTLTPVESAYTRASSKRRRMLIDRAARLIGNPNSKPNEKATSIYHLQVALGIESAVVFEVLKSVLGSGASDADLEKLKDDAAAAQANFDNLVGSLQSFRASLTKIGAIKEGDRLPATSEEWQRIVANVMAKETQKLAAQRDHLAQQKRELEERKAEALGEIAKARDALQDQIKEKTPLLQRLSGKAFAPIERAASAEKGISAISFGYDHIEVFEIAKLVKGKGIYMGEWEPADLDGQPVGFKLSVFVSPKPLTEVTGKALTFNDTAAEIGKLKGWQGYDGCKLDPTRYYAEFCNELRTDPDSMLGKWMIAPLELVRGRDRDGNKVRAENMYDLRNKGDLAKANGASQS